MRIPLCGKTGKEIMTHSDKRIKIKISTLGTGTPFIKQAPHLIPMWKNCDFYINQPIESCDVWVVYGGLLTEETVQCPKDATIFITNEPPSVKRFSRKFTDQFATVITCHGGTVRNHPHIVYEQQALPWWVGHKMKRDDTDQVLYEKTYDELKKIATPPKTKLISVIASNKRFTRGHRRRDTFVQYLKKELGDIVDVYGVGNTLVEDKWDAIAPYKYHIVIENSTYRDYWTEKLSDCLLAESYPFYYGAPNIEKYFDKQVFTQIDINDPTRAIESIRKSIKNNLYEKATPLLAEAKEKVLDTYQFFPFISSLVQKYHTKNVPVSITLAPEKNSSIVHTVKKLLRPYLSYVKHKNC